MKSILPCMLLLAGIAFSSYAQWTTNGNNINNTNTGHVTIGSNPSYSGNFGIGTSNPGAKVDIVGNTSNVKFKMWSSSGPPSSAVLEIGSTGIGGAFETSAIQINGGPIIGNVRIGSKYTYDFSLFSNDTDRLTVKADGKIGIGTSSPNYLLDVNGIINATNILINGQPVGSGGGGGSVWSMSGANAFYNSGSVGIGTTAPTAMLEVSGPSSGSGATIKAGGGGDVMLNGGGSLFFDGNYSYTSGNYIRPVASNTQAFFTSGAERMRIAPNGTIGMGVTSPYSSARLHVKGRNSSVPGLIMEAHSNDRIIGISHTGSHGIVAVSYLGSGGYSPLQFWTENAPRMTIGTNGKIGVGTTTPDELLTVKGNIHAEEVVIDTDVPGPDYVFEEDYELAPLSEVEAYIKQNKHLPEVPSAKEMEAEGIRAGEMNMLLLKKVEELTLYVIELEKKVKQLEAEK